MWPLDLPARDVIKLPGETSISWAEFDAAWYRRTYPETSGVESGAQLLAHYAEIGQRLGRSANRFFDEAWHRAVYPQIAAAVAQFHYDSAFDAYCRRGCLDRSPHWLFDELAYRDLYPGLTGEALAAGGLANGYDHYLRHGDREERIGHKLFNPAVYLANFDSSEADAIRRHGPFRHYLERIETAAPDLRTSIYFDPPWYLRRYPEVAAAIQAGRWTCALHHYLCNDTPVSFDPLESFSEQDYLDADPGLRAVVKAGQFRNGYSHFLRYGANEHRSPCAGIDLAWYARQPEVRTGIEHGRAADAFAHWLIIGRPAGAASSPARGNGAISPRPPVRDQDEALLPIAGRFGYRFESGLSPQVSVVMSVHDGFAGVMAAIASLHSEISTGAELIIVDRGSLDETRHIAQYVPGARVLRFDSDIGAVRAADAGRQLARAPAVLFFDPDVRIAPGSVRRALARLNGDPAAGAVSALVLRSSGAVAQAGGIVWNDGSATDYLQGASALAPEANFVRDVDYGSSAFLLVHAEWLARLGGFDFEFFEAYAWIDLCLRIRASGCRVIYDPSVLVFHAGGDAAAGAPDDRFLKKHAGILAQCLAPGENRLAFARHAGPPQRRILFLEDTVPLRRLGSGFVRSNDIVRVMASLGFGVTVYPLTASRYDAARVFGDMPETVEVMRDRDLAGLEIFLTERLDYYDTIWVARSHNLDKVHGLLTELIARSAVSPMIVLDTEAIAPARQAVQARLSGRAFDLPEAMRVMLQHADLCRRVVAVTPREADMLRAAGMADVAVIGHMVQPYPAPKTFDQRAGMLFVGAFHTKDCPNLDSLDWFVDSVLPLIEKELGWETRLTIAGYAAPGVELGRFADHPRVTLRGPVSDLQPLYNAARVFVAPTRFAAGAPYKLFEAAAYGLPIVATELLRGQLAWGAEQELLSAGADDPAGFAARVVALYRDESLWTRLRDAALRRLARDNGPGDFTAAVAEVLIAD